MKKGATSIWETWDGVREDGTVHDSLNHYSYGAISGWLMKGVCGIRLSRGKITICPQPHPSLGFARACWESPAGRIESGWEYREERLIFTVKVPGKAVIALPDGQRYEVEAGSHSYEIPAVL